MSAPRALLMLASAFALVGNAASGQTRSSKVFARYNKPLRSATLDLATGVIERGPIVTNRGAPTVVDFANNDLSGFVGVDTGNGFCEWFDAGVKGSLVGDGTALVNSGNNESDGLGSNSLMNSIVFAYCSSALSPASGGPGGSVKLGFYEGYTTFGGAPTTGVAALTLTGLPGNSASSSFFGGFTCLLLRVSFGGLVSFRDGPIGYSWKFLDQGTGTLNPMGAVLAATWPFLSCVASCSGAMLQIDSQGMTDVIDQYCPPGYLRGTFSFGTTSGSFTSMAMHIEEVQDTPAPVALVNSSTNPNPDILESGDAVIGHQLLGIRVTLGIGRTKGALSWHFFLGSGTVNPPAGTAIPQFSGGLNFGSNKSGRMLLCSLNPGPACSGTHSGVSGSTTAALDCPFLRVPTSLSLVGNPWYGQAVVLGIPTAADGGGNARLSSMITGTIGTF